jgi:hypothetical protein
MTVDTARHKPETFRDKVREPTRFAGKKVVCAVRAGIFLPNFASGIRDGRAGYQDYLTKAAR